MTGASKHLFETGALEAFLESESRLVAAILDGEGNILQSNSGLERLFKTAERRLPDNVHDFLDDRSRDVLRQVLLSIPDQGEEGGPGQFRKCSLHFRAAGSAVHTLACFLCSCGGNIAFFAERRQMTDSDIIEKMSHMNNDLANLSRELSRKNAELERANETITRLVHTDVLTGLENRRSIMDRAEKMLGDAEREKNLVSVVMADLDHFKNINDTWGHAAGDRVLEAFGDLLRKSLRTEDHPGRIGGEEFLILLPGMGGAGASVCAERLRKAVEALQLEYPPQQVTASFGVASRRPGENRDELMRRADEALYLAKASGRNRVEMAK